MIETFKHPASPTPYYLSTSKGALQTPHHLQRRLTRSNHVASSWRMTLPVLFLHLLGSSHRKTKVMCVAVTGNSMSAPGDAATPHFAICAALWLIDIWPHRPRLDVSRGAPDNSQPWLMARSLPVPLLLSVRSFCRKTCLTRHEIGPTAGRAFFFEGM